MRQNDLISSALDGAATAAIDYMYWSKDWTIDDSRAESLVTIGIARGIIDYGTRQRDRQYIWWETDFDEIKYQTCSSSRSGRRLKESSGRPRVDLVHWNQNEEIVTIFEVKRSLSENKMKRDALRICAVMRECSESDVFRFGGLVGLETVRSNYALKDIEKKGKKIANSFRKLKNATGMDVSFHCRHMPVREPYVYGLKQNSITAVAAGCVLFHRV
jgi:hypothetical protein